MFDQFTEIINQSSPLLFGLASAFTPCTIAIFPLLLYRFGFGKNTEERQKNVAGLLIVAISFVGTFALTGFVLQFLILSIYANVFRLVLGCLLVFGGVLLITGRLNLATSQKFSHPILIGISLPWLLSFSPCVLAFTANLIVTNSNSTPINGSSTIQFTLFALGILLPPILLALAGNAFLPLMRRFSSYLGFMDKISPIALLLAGIFLISQLVQVTSAEVAIAGIILLIGAFGLWLKYLREQQPIELNLFFTIVTFSIIIFGVLLAYFYTKQYDYLAVAAEKLIYLCTPQSHTASPASAILATILSILSLLAGGWYTLLTSTWLKLPAKVQ